MKKITKRFIALLVCLVMTVSLLPVYALADDEDVELVDSGLYRGNVYWGYYDDGTLAIVGEGTVADRGVPWRAYRNNIQYIIIDEGITRLEPNAFNDYPNLQIVLLSRTVEDVSPTNFANCPNFIAFIVDEDNPRLTADELGVLYNKDMTTIYRAPTGITISVIPETVKTILYNAYGGCTDLSQILFLGNLPSIWSDAFSGVTAAAYYYADNSTWSKINDHKYTDADITWYGIIDEDYCGEETAYLLLSNGILDINGLGAMYDYAADGENASPFAKSEDITYIWFGSEITHIGKNAFTDCPNLSTLFFNSSAAPTMTDSFEGIRAVGLYPSVWTGTPSDHGGDILWVKYDAETGDLLGTGILGDVNVDGEISNADLILVARYVVNLIEEDSFQHEFVEAFGDMDHSGDIGNTDIISIARAIVGLE